MKTFWLIKKYWLAETALVCMLLMPGASVLAQSATSTVGINLTVIPSTTTFTNAQLSAQATLVGADPKTATFYWYFNNGSIPTVTGINRTLFTFQAPASPGSYPLRVRATIPNQNPVEATTYMSVQLSPADIQNNLSAVGASLLGLSQININTSNDSPAPGEAVLLTATSLGDALAAATFEWRVNGKIAKSGKGEQTLSLSLGAAGTGTSVDLAITKIDGTVLRASKTLIPLSISFYWWADTYVPTWYQGKALATPGSTIHIQARPSYADAIANSLVYTWKINGDIIPSQSGQAKSIFAYTIPAVKELVDTISVKVENISGTFSQEATFPLPLAEPEALIYQKIPLSGIDGSRAISSIPIQSGGANDFIAEPFFAPKNYVKDLQYQWVANNQVLENKGASPELLTLRSAAGIRGNQDISVTIQSAVDKLFRIFGSFAASVQ
ncbi:MAG: hypothetical protein HY220_01465 [Candidatus Sungbacteria bacterium]|uniref:PKD domain-containing protein n=1 Tax=Candidatus Sungiibacteriota bacterium TaxID=2750080 RepID=A0A9D6LSR3_9BACT|nr:hypothetical protein [Candidatus Sungbacteria bacterium]